MTVRRDFERDGDRLPVSVERRDDQDLVRIGDDELLTRAERLHDGRIAFVIDGKRHTACVARTADAVIVRLDGHTWRLPLHRAGRSAAEVGSGDLVAPMTGTVLDVRVQTGDRVTTGQTLAIVSAMKMEHKLTAAFDGVVTKIGAAAGDQVAQGASIVQIEADAPPDGGTSV